MTRRRTGFDRRSVLGGMATAAAVAVSGCATPAPPRRRTPLGLVDITVMAELGRDYPGTLARVAALGYTSFGFRLAGYGGPEPGEPSPAEKARAVRAAGLEVGVVRLGVRNVDYDAQLRQIADIGATVAAMSIAAPFVATREVGRTTRAAFDAWLPELAAIGEKARKLGLTLAYHNHDFDLRPLGGEAPLDSMARTIPAEVLAFEVDLAWTWYAGVPPLALLERLGPRVASMHWKDIDRRRGTDRNELAVAPGSGEMNYPALLPRIARLTSATGYVEVDKPADGLAAAASGAAVVRRALGEKA